MSKNQMKRLAKFKDKAKWKALKKEKERDKK